MRYLKRQNINRRIPQSTTVYSDAADANVYINPRNSGSLALPQGTDAQIPSNPVNGMMRYNADHDEVQVYQSNTWRSLRFKESTKIVQQNLGAGDSATVYFGPLNSLYSPSNISSENDNFAGQNVLVVVENVLQLAGSNYTVVQNPTLSSQVYQPTTSTTSPTGSTVLSFSTSLTVTAAGASGGIATLTFNTQTKNPFRIGQPILVTGMTPVAYNGSFTVSNVSPSSVSYTSSATGAMTVSGVVTGAGTIYAGTPIIGATVTGNGAFQSATLVQSIVVEQYTNALISITLSQPTLAALAPGITLTITENTQVGSGYYLFFSSPPPYGKIVTALLGFDQ